MEVQFKKRCDLELGPCPLICGLDMYNYITKNKGGEFEGGTTRMQYCYLLDSNHEFVYSLQQKGVTYIYIEKIKPPNHLN